MNVGYKLTTNCVVRIEHSLVLAFKYDDLQAIGRLGSGKGVFHCYQIMFKFTMNLFTQKTKRVTVKYLPE